MTAADLANCLGARRSGNSYTANCPVCGYYGGLRFTDGNPDQQGRPRILARCYGAGCSFREIMVACRESYSENRSLTCTSRSVARGQARPSRQDDDDLGEATRRLWSRARPPAGTPVEMYLSARGITGRIPAAIRYLPDAKHTESGERLPCMIAAIRRWPGDEVVAVHRTFLAADGRTKASVEPARKSWGSPTGGAVRLGKMCGEIIAAEGIETALSASELIGLPAWAALSAGGIEKLILPPGISVVIVADHDQVGLAAAHRAATRWRADGRTVRILAPMAAGCDANDTLREMSR